MNSRAADLRFVAPHPVASVRVAGEGPRQDLMREAFASIGLDARSAGLVDLLIVPAGAPAGSWEHEARTVVWEGRAPRGVLRARGGHAQRLFVGGDVVRPSAIVPTHPDTLLHHLRVTRPPSNDWRGLRNRALVSMLERRVPPTTLVPRRHTMTLATRRTPSTLPWLVRSAQDIVNELDQTTDWTLSLGRGDDLQRAVFHLLTRRTCDWIVKFGRLPAAAVAFDRDERGLTLAHDAGPAVSSHTPQLAGRLEVDGLPVSVESAAQGRPLTHGLSSSSLPVIEAVASWTLDMAVATARPHSSLRPERQRLEKLLRSTQRSLGGSQDVEPASTLLQDLPAVLQHNDLGTWNIITDGEGFTVVDWESARPAGFPLWDLLYFLGDALPRLEGHRTAAALTEASLRLFRGQSPWSPVLFRWVRAAVSKLALPSSAVGTVAALGFLHHGESASIRERRLGDSSPVESGHLARLAKPWLADPALGLEWSTWR